MDQPLLAQAFGYSTSEEVAGTCILLLFSAPAIEKPSAESPDPREWARAADRRRFKVLAPVKIRKNHEASKSRAQRINRPPPLPRTLAPGGPGPPGDSGVGKGKIKREYGAGDAPTDV